MKFGITVQLPVILSIVLLIRRSKLARYQNLYISLSPFSQVYIIYFFNFPNLLLLLYSYKLFSDSNKPQA